MRVLSRFATAVPAIAMVSLVTAAAAAEPECDDPPMLSPLSGELVRTGGTFFVAGEEVDPGPEWYLVGTTASVDYDGDGQLESMWAELDGLTGTEVSIQVDDAGRGGDRDLYTINALEWRVADGCPPPWAGGPGRNGPPSWAGDQDRGGPPPWAGCRPGGDAGDVEGHDG